MSGRIVHVRLTAMDCENNGFVSLARWPKSSKRKAELFIAQIDAEITEDMEPDAETAQFAFILDIVGCDYTIIDTSRHLLPTQIAMRLAPKQVAAWLDERPDPNTMATMERPVPLLDEISVSQLEISS